MGPAGVGKGGRDEYVLAGQATGGVAGHYPCPVPNHCPDWAAPARRSVVEAVVGKLVDPPDRRSIGRANEVVDDVLADPRLFAAVFAAFHDEQPVVRMRAADAIEKVSRERPELLDPHAEALLAIAATTRDTEVRWHAAQLLGRAPLAAAHRSRVVEVLLGYLDDASGIVKTCAMQALADLADEDQELTARIVPLLEQLTATGSPAMRARGRKLLRMLAADRG